LYQELKLRKKHKYIIFGLSEDKTEIVKLKAETSTDYDVFLADLPEDKCRWAVYDFEFQKEDSGQRNKIVFYHWYVLPSSFRCVTILPYRPPFFCVANAFVFLCIININAGLGVSLLVQVAR